MIKGKIIGLWKLSYDFQNIKLLLQIYVPTVVHIYRENNSVAVYLATLSIRLGDSFTYPHFAVQSKILKLAI